MLLGKMRVNTLFFFFPLKEIKQKKEHFQSSTKLRQNRKSDWLHRFSLFHLGPSDSRLSRQIFLASRRATPGHTSPTRPRSRMELPPISRAPSTPPVRLCPQGERRGAAARASSTPPSAAPPPCGTPPAPPAAVAGGTARLPPRPPEGARRRLGPRLPPPRRPGPHNLSKFPWLAPARRGPPPPLARLPGFFMPCSPRLHPRFTRSGVRQRPLSLGAGSGARRGSR